MSESQPSSPDYANRPRVCRNCGAIVGAGEDICSACGASQSDAGNKTPRARRPVYDIEAVRFARAILTRPATFSIIFLMANFFVYLLMWGENGMKLDALGQFPFETLIAYGAKVNSLINGSINNQHQWWRFVTPVFIHVSLMHLLINMYGLWQLGPLVERLYGSARFVVFWVLTGIAGVAASYWTVRPGMAGALGGFLFKAQDVPSAGASGALFGLVGVLFVFGIKYRHELPENFKRAFGTGMLPIILINFFIGYVGRGLIDNAAHVGGLVAGAALASIVNYRRPDERGSGVAIFWRALQIAAIALVAVSFVMVARNFHNTMAIARSALASAQADADAQKIEAYLNALNNGAEAVDATLKSHDASKIDTALREVERAPRLDEKAGALLDELKSLLGRAREFVSMPTGQPAQLREAKRNGEQLATDFDAWVNKRDGWVKTDGAKYHIELVENSSDSSTQNQNSRQDSQNQR